MLRAGPQTYQRLKPFRALFAAGLPILTWHKLGPVHPAPRLKGLYLSARVSSARFPNFSEAGFKTITLDGLGSASRVAKQKEAPTRHRTQRALVLTFDDGYRKRLSPVPETSREARFQAIQSWWRTAWAKLTTGISLWRSPRTPDGPPAVAGLGCRPATKSARTLSLTLSLPGLAPRALERKFFFASQKRS